MTGCAHGESANQRRVRGLQGLHYGNRSPFFKMETQRCSTAAAPHLAACCSLAQRHLLSADRRLDCTGRCSRRARQVLRLPEGRSRAAHCAGAEADARSGRRPVHLGANGLRRAALAVGAARRDAQLEPAAGMRELKVLMHSELGSPSAGEFLAARRARRTTRRCSISRARRRRGRPICKSAARKRSNSRRTPARRCPARSRNSGATCSRRARRLSPPAERPRCRPTITPARPSAPGDELNAMLGQQGKIRQQFAGLLGSHRHRTRRRSIKPSMYWELLSVGRARRADAGRVLQPRSATAAAFRRRARSIMRAAVTTPASPCTSSGRSRWMARLPRSSGAATWSPRRRSARSAASSASPPSRP